MQLLLAVGEILYPNTHKPRSLELTEPFLQVRGPQERPLTVLLQPAKQADKYVTPSAPHTGVKESVWHSQLLLQGEYGSRDEVGVEL